MISTKKWEMNNRANHNRLKLDIFLKVNVNAYLYFLWAMVLAILPRTVYFQVLFLLPFSSSSLPLFFSLEQGMIFENYIAKVPLPIDST